MTAQELAAKARASANLAIAWAQADRNKAQEYIEQANIWLYVAQEAEKLT